MLANMLLCSKPIEEDTKVKSTTVNGSDKISEVIVIDHDNIDFMVARSLSVFAGSVDDDINTMKYKDYTMKCTINCNMSKCIEFVNEVFTKMESIEKIRGKWIWDEEGVYTRDWQVMMHAKSCISIYIPSMPGENGCSIINGPSELEKFKRANFLILSQSREKDIVNQWINSAYTLDGYSLNTVLREESFHFDLTNPTPKRKLAVNIVVVDQLADYISISNVIIDPVVTYIMNRDGGHHLFPMYPLQQQMLNWDDCKPVKPDKITYTDCVGKRLDICLDYMTDAEWKAFAQYVMSESWMQGHKRFTTTEFSSNLTYLEQANYNKLSTITVYSITNRPTINPYVYRERLEHATEGIMFSLIMTKCFSSEFINSFIGNMPACLTKKINKQKISDRVPYKISNPFLGSRVMCNIFLGDTDTAFEVLDRRVIDPLLWNEYPSLLLYPAMPKN